MTKRKNSRRAAPRKHKKERNKAWDLLGHKQTLKVCLRRMRILCSYCNSENDIFDFLPRNKKDRGRHSSRRSSAIAISTPALTQYIGIAHWQTIWICMGIVPCGKTYTRLFSPSRSLSCLTDFPFSRQCDKSRNIRIGNMDFFSCGF